MFFAPNPPGQEFGQHRYDSCDQTPIDADMDIEKDKDGAMKITTMTMMMMAI